VLVGKGEWEEEWFEADEWLEDEGLEEEWLEDEWSDGEYSESVFVIASGLGRIWGVRGRCGVGKCGS